MNKLRYGHIMGRLVNVPLAVHPRTAMVFYNALCGRFGAAPGELPETEDAELLDKRLRGLEEQFALEMARPRRYKVSRFIGNRVAAEDGPGQEPYRIHKGIGILEVMGELVNRGAWVGSQSGMTSYEGLKFQMSRIARDNRVQRVLMDFDSPGGEAVGFVEAAAAVRQLNDVKPVTAIVNGIAASGGYALASGAKRIVTTPTGVSGSIGVVMLHLDHSQEMAEAGIVPTLIYAGSHKVDGNAFEPLSESVREQLQQEVSTFYNAFIQTVATGRAGRISAKAAKETEARTFIGEEAVAARLADEVGTFEEVLSDMARKASRTSQSSSRSQAMSRRAVIVDDDDEVRGPAEFAAMDLEYGGVRFQDVTALTEHVRGASTAAALARIGAIMADDRSRGRERFAVRLACMNPDLSPDEVLELAVEGNVTPSVRPIGERTAATGANEVTSQPEPVAGQGEGKTGGKWTKIAEKQNAETRRHVGGKRTALSS